MKKPLSSICLLLAGCVFAGCATPEPRVRAGIQDPIERHQPSFWHSAAKVPLQWWTACVHGGSGPGGGR